MPSKRRKRTRDLRRHWRNALTSDQLFLLLRGYSHFQAHPFRSDADALAAWQAHRKEILSACRSESGARTYSPGTRPWAWWKFDQNEDPPMCQGGLLDDMGELGAEEREVAIKLARKEWDRWADGLTPEARKQAVKMTDGTLLEFWPALPDFD